MAHRERDAQSISSSVLRLFFLALLCGVVGCNSVDGLWTGDCVGGGDATHTDGTFATTFNLTDSGGSVTGSMLVVDPSGNSTSGTADGTRLGKGVDLTVGIGLVGYTDYDSFHGRIEDDTMDGNWSVSGYNGALNLTCTLFR